MYLKTSPSKYYETGNFFDRLLSFLPLLLVNQQGAAQNEEKGLKDYYKEFFPIGVAVNARSLAGNEAELLLKEFNSITPENAMKMGPIHPGVLTKAALLT